MKSDQKTLSAEAALRERIKELTCLYGIAQIAGKPGITLGEILQSIAELLPPAWQYPEITSARIILDGNTYTTPAFHDSHRRQTADIVVAGVRRGAVEVVYREKKPEIDQTLFLEEERSLIDAVAAQVASIIDLRQAEEDKSMLQSQLRHADRLATIGLLAAGVAHELNEPIGNVLGFAQLVKKCEGLPEQARDDIGKIEHVALYARDVITKLLVFARQMPPQKMPVSLNRVVEDAIYFFRARCAKEGIEVECRLEPDLPEIVADPAQLNQVVVNLVVNAFQAMPKGGSLTIRTGTDDRGVLLTVEDTGMGMEEETVEKIFVPFFTTKDVGEGTGLGLPVAHGIVTSHGGSIAVSSEIGRGTRFEILLPIEGRAETVRDGDK